MYYFFVFEKNLSKKRMRALDIIMAMLSNVLKFSYIYNNPLMAPQADVEYLG